MKLVSSPPTYPEWLDKKIQGIWDAIDTWTYQPLPEEKEIRKAVDADYLIIAYAESLFLDDQLIPTPTECLEDIDFSKAYVTYHRVFSPTDITPVTRPSYEMRPKKPCTEYSGMS